MDDIADIAVRTHHVKTGGVQIITLVMQGNAKLFCGNVEWYGPQTTEGRTIVQSIGRGQRVNQLFSRDLALRALLSQTGDQKHADQKFDLIGTRHDHWYRLDQ